MLPTVDQVNESLRYRQDGTCWWRFRPRHHFSTESAWLCHLSRNAGREAGFLHQDLKTGDMRVLITLNGLDIMRAKLVWVLNHGIWPTTKLDHANRTSTDDRIENLRLCTNSENGANRVRGVNNTSGFKGVSWHLGSRKWQSAIRVDGKLLYLGLFTNRETAAAAYIHAAEYYWGDFAYSG